MMFHWTIVLAAFALGIIIGRMSKPDVTFRGNRASEVTKADPLEPLNKEWLAMCEPHIHKFEVGAVFGTGVSFNREGSKAMSVLIFEMANRLDYAKHHMKKMREDA